MSLLEELQDKGATIAWSSTPAHANLIALGTKDSGGVGFDDYGGVLELHMLNLSGPGPASTLMGKVKTSARFATLAWSEMATKQEFSYGIVAGGMSDGTVNVWDPAKLVANHATPKLTSLQQHSGPVTGLAFNPHKSSSHLLASGGADASVFVMSLDRPEQPNVFVPAPPPSATKHSAEVTKCAWNSQVGHILATGSGNGQCIVWDLRQKKPWCELRDAARGAIADVAWNPDQGLHILTASGDDNNPVLKLWDLRSSTSLPLATLQGHSQGVLSVAWCPTDASLLMSCAKDNRTLMWDLYKLQPVYELPSGGSAAGTSGSGAGDNQMFGGLGNAASNRRYQVQWSPQIPAVIATCSFDRKVQVFSMAGARNSSGRPPKWLNRPCGASFGFGGKLVRFSKASEKSQPKVVRIQTVRQDTKLVSSSQSFEQALSTKELKVFCKQKEVQARTSHERHIWQFMQVIFETNAREQLLTHLGFDAETIAAEIASYEPSKSSAPSPKDIGGKLEAVTLATPPVTNGTEGPAAPAGAAGLFQPAVKASGGGQTGALSEETEKLIKRALLVGNFEAAVDCCLAAGNMADALLLASCGGADLWAKTQAAYFERGAQERSYLTIVSAIIKSELTELVEKSDLSKWQETLAILSTYAKSEEFATLCEALADRLESQAMDRPSANLCYMCAVNVPKTISMWADELHAAAVRSGAAGRGKGSSVDPTSLQEFVEKVTIFRQADEGVALEESASALFAQYAGMLAAEGEMQTAAKYIAGSSDKECAILQDRLFHAAGGVGMPPPFPFDPNDVAISTSPAQVQMQPLGSTATSTAAAAAASFSSPGPGMPGSSGGGASFAAATPAAPATELPLPQGWTQMIDPSSGAYYYHNQNTGATQWERPAPVPVVHHPAPPQNLPTAPSQASTAAAGGGMFAARPGGLPSLQQSPSMASHPSVMQPNVMQPSVMQPSVMQPSAMQPSVMQPSVMQPSVMQSGVPASSVPAPAAPVPAPALTPAEAIAAASAVGGESCAVVQSVQSLIGHLEKMPLNPSQKKMLAEVSKASHVLFCKIAEGAVEADIVSKVNSFFHQLAARDIHGAMTIHQVSDDSC
jgi:protein transport protein SEC31